MMSDATPAWVEPLCLIGVEWRNSGQSLRDLFRRASPKLSDLIGMRHHIQTYLSSHPTLIDAWQKYSWDKRGSPSPFIDVMRVGFYDHGYHDVRQYDDRAAACADFICREASWVLEQRRVTFRPEDEHPDTTSRGTIT